MSYTSLYHVSIVLSASVIYAHNHLCLGYSFHLGGQSTVSAAEDTGYLSQDWAATILLGLDLTFEFLTHFPRFSDFFLALGQVCNP